MEAGTLNVESYSSTKPKVPYEEARGYGTLARVDPALAEVERPIRYLDLRPTTPEADEVQDTLQKWRDRVLAAPYPVNKAELMRQVHDEERHREYPVIVAVEQMIEMRLAVEARQTAIRLAAREQFEARKMSAQEPIKRRTCTQTSGKQTPDARTSSTFQSRCSSGKDKGPRMYESTMAFRALEEGESEAKRPRVSKSSRSRENALERMNCNPVEVEPDLFVFSESDIVSPCEEDI